MIHGMTGDDGFSDWTLDDFDPARPSPARVYDYWLGGTYNFSADRELAERAIAAWPEIPQVMRQNRAFLQRAVRFLISVGIRQFLDLGSGIPTEGNVHQIARQENPDTKIVYVDLDPVAVTHSRALVHDYDGVTVLQADLREPEQVLKSNQLQALLDLDKPVGVLMVAMLHFVADDEDPAGIVSRYRDALMPGSYLALSHACRHHLEDFAVEHEQIYRRAGMTIRVRSLEEIAALFDGFQLVEPGLVPLPQWRPEAESTWSDERPFPGAGGVGRKS